MFQFSYPHMLFLTKRHHFYKTSISEAHFISYESFKIPYHSYLPISWLFPCSLWNLALGYTSLWMSTSLTEELRTVGPSQHQQPLSSVPMSSLWALLSLITALIGIQLGNCLTMSYTPLSSALSYSSTHILWCHLGTLPFDLALYLHWSFVISLPSWTFSWGPTPLILFF